MNTILEHISKGISIVGAAIILRGFCKTLTSFLITEIKYNKKTTLTTLLNNIRCKLGTYILLGLDFMIVADILHSIVHTELEDLYKLGLIVIIRIAIAYFLEKEVEEIEELYIKK